MKESAYIINVAYDCTTSWNLRHDSIEAICKPLSNKDALIKLNEELDFTLNSIMKNPKIYCHWEYRRFILKECLKRKSNETASMIQAIIKKEYKLCRALLDVDCRNFHCWNHRKWLSNLVNASFEDEMNFTDDFRQKDPGNYSALHYRSVILSKHWKTVNPSIVSIEIMEGLY